MRAFRSKCYTVAQMDQKLKAFISNCPPANHSCAGWAQLPASSCSKHNNFLRCNNLCSETSQQLRRSLWCHPHTAIATWQSCSPCPIVACPEHSHPAWITAGDCQHIKTQLHHSGRPGLSAHWWTDQCTPHRKGDRQEIRTGFNPERPCSWQLLIWVHTSIRSTCICPLYHPAARETKWLWDICQTLALLTASLEDFFFFL